MKCTFYLWKCFSQFQISVNISTIPELYKTMVSPLASHLPGLPWGETVSFYLCPTIACLVCHRLNTSPVYIPTVSPLATHLPGLPWEETVSFYLCPTIACLVCHRLNTSPVHIPMVSLLASHLPGLPWEETVSFYLCPTIAIVLTNVKIIVRIEIKFDNIWCCGMTMVFVK